MELPQTRILSSTLTCKFFMVQDKRIWALRYMCIRWWDLYLKVFPAFGGLVSQVQAQTWMACSHVKPVDRWFQVQVWGMKLKINPQIRRKAKLHHLKHTWKGSNFFFSPSPPNLQAWNYVEWAINTKALSSWVEGGFWSFNSLALFHPPKGHSIHKRTGDVCNRRELMDVSSPSTLLSPDM